MDLASTYDANQRDLNLSDILHGESLVKGAQNLHAVTLYVYPNFFLVFYIKSLKQVITNFLVGTKQGYSDPKETHDRQKNWSS